MKNTCYAVLPKWIKQANVRGIKPDVSVHFGLKTHKHFVLHTFLIIGQGAKPFTAMSPVLYKSLTVTFHSKAGKNQCETYQAKSDSTEQNHIRIWLKSSLVVKNEPKCSNQSWLKVQAWQLCSSSKDVSPQGSECCNKMLSHKWPCTLQE